jgi:hypothetical protein
LREEKRWQVQNDRLDRQEARASELQNLQMETAKQNIAEVQRGRQFKMGMAQATSKVQDPIGKFHARMEYLDAMEATHPDLAANERQSTIERGQTYSNELWKRGNKKESAYIDDAMMGEYYRRRGNKDFKITYSESRDEDLKWLNTPEGEKPFRLEYDESTGTEEWKEVSAGLPEGITSAKEATATDQDDYVEAMRQATIDEGGKFTARDEANARRDFKRAGPDERAAVTTAIEESKRKAKLMGQMPKARASFKAFDRTTELTNRTIDEALALADATTTGMAAKATKNIPGTDAFTLREKLKTIQANIAFGYLQEMRNNSPTGGAVGQLSERELELMGVTKASLNQDLDDAALIENLERIKQELSDMRDDAAYAYKLDFGVDPVTPETKPQAKVTVEVENPETGEMETWDINTGQRVK